MDEMGTPGSTLRASKDDLRITDTDTTTHHELDELPLLIPVPRAAALLGISRSAAYRCAASGDLPTAHLGGRVYVVTRRLQQFLESA